MLESGLSRPRRVYSKESSSNNSPLGFSISHCRLLSICDTQQDWRKHFSQRRSFQTLRTLMKSAVCSIQLRDRLLKSPHSYPCRELRQCVLWWKAEWLSKPPRRHHQVSGLCMYNCFLHSTAFSCSAPRRRSIPPSKGQPPLC